MKKQLVFTFAILLALTVLFCGCNEQTNNNNNNENPLYNIELISHYPAFQDNLIEVNGIMRNNGTATLDVIAEVLFYNADNELIYSSSYTVCDFANGTDASFFVMYQSVDPNFEQYDHYDIELKLAV